MSTMIEVEGLAKTFTLHTQGGVRLPVFKGVSLSVGAGECLCLTGPSGAGKSTLLRALYGNYAPTGGTIRINTGERMTALRADGDPRATLALRRHTIGYVSQFLRVIPRVATLDLVMQPAQAAGIEAGAARDKAEALLRHLTVPERLWPLAPATFSGGEQQRINIARGFVAGYPVLLLDEPTASLDAANRERVVELIVDAKAQGVCVVAIVHDPDIRARIADRQFDVAACKEAA